MVCPIRTSSEASRLEEEVKLLQALRHKNVVRFFGSWNKDPETKIFITELMTSGTLKQFLRKTGKVKPRVLQSWLKQILTGLQYVGAIFGIMGSLVLRCVAPCKPPRSWLHW